MTASQGLWQHGGGEFLVVIALLAITGERRMRNEVVLGLAIGLLTANRPPDVVLSLGFAAGAWWWTQRRPWLVLGAALVPALLLLTYNAGMFGNAFGGYGVKGVASPSFFSRNPLIGIPGLLVSP